MKKTNKSIKSTYNSIFKKGYTQVYTVNERKHSDGKNKDLKFTEEMLASLHAVSWKNKKVLEVGCGTGLFSYAAATRGAKIIGMDYIPEAIKEAEATYNHPNLEYKVGDASSIKGKFDVIVSIGTLEHLDDPLKILKSFKRHLLPGGVIVTTSPNWMNPRGYVLQALLHLFDAPITLADLHYLTPVEFEEFAKKLKMSLTWKTFDHDWGHGERMITDLKKRLPNVLRDAKLPNKQANIDKFIDWLEKHVLSFDHESKFSGATGIYVMK